MAGRAGKRAGSRRGARAPRRLRPRLLALALGVTLLVVAWGYLVYAAVDFGTEARAGSSRAWWFLALASLGAVACLFAGLMLIARLLRELGIIPPPAAADPAAADPAAADPAAADPSTAAPASPGRRRAAR